MKKNKKELFTDYIDKGLSQSRNSIFPSGFYWGAATSAHQVEGGNHNDWSEWELKNAKIKAQIAKNNPPVGGWPEFILESYPNPLQEENYISGICCDHYNKYEEDFDIAKSLGHNAHRFSIEWSRIEPEEGKFNEKEIEHYRKVILALKKKGLEPFVTLWHWTLPLWLAEKKGVRNRNFPKYFERYVSKIADKFGSEIKYWMIINEPEIYSLNAYFRGRWVPQRRGIFSFYWTIRKLIKAHKLAYKAIKKIDTSSVVGSVCNLSDFKSSEGVINVLLRVFFERFWNHYFLRNVKNYLDCIGLNFYFHNRIDYGLNKNTNEVISDVGWDLHPEDIEDVLKDLKQYHKPIFITESGLADKKDEDRAWFIKETVEAISRALSANVDVRGYFHWSLLDNFEWDKGFWPRFGLVEIDYKTMERKIRKSAWEYKKIIENSK